MKEREERDALSDQITLLLLFKALHDLGLPTRRVKLQKLVYFANVLGNMFGKKITGHEFFVWKYGPFSKQVYSDVELFVTRGWVKATPLSEFEEPDEKSFEYDITDTGLSKTKKALEDPEFKSKYEIILNSLQATGHLTSGQIKKLSYGEPEFRKASESGRTTVINSEFPVAHRMADLARKVAENDFHMKLTDDEVALLYLKLVEALALEK